MEQTNSLISELTVAEMLLYTAELKRDPREPLEVGSALEYLVVNVCLSSSRAPRGVFDCASSPGGC